MQFRNEFKTADERTFDRSGLDVTFRSEPAETYPFTHITIERGGETFSDHLHYSHHALGLLATDFEFDTVLEVGCGGGVAANAFRFLGKEVTGVEIQKGLEATVKGDFASIDFGRKFDAVWCSHVLEHQRNVGAFLDKCFDVLHPNGVLALTVPSALAPMIIGHPNVFTPLHLIYSLILAGFDCSDAMIKQYDWQFSIVVQKTANGLARLPFASQVSPLSSYRDDEPGYVPNLLNFFPAAVRDELAPHGIAWGEIEELNWLSSPGAVGVEGHAAVAA